MERLIQYLDNLEDGIYVIVLLAERIRRIMIKLCVLAGVGVASAIGFLLTATDSTAGMTVAALLTVMILYRLATTAPQFAAPAVPG